MISKEDIENNYIIWLQIKSQSVYYTKNSLYNRFFHQYKRLHITENDFLSLKKSLSLFPRKWKEKITYQEYVRFMEQNYMHTLEGKKEEKKVQESAFQKNLIKFMSCRDMNVLDLSEILELEPEIVNDIISGKVHDKNLISCICNLFVM